MATGEFVELYGTCKQLGYCDCGGFFGCIDADGPGDHRKVEVKASRLSLRPDDDQPIAIELPKPRTVFADPASNEELPDCGYCRRKGSRCKKHLGRHPGGLPSTGLSPVAPKSPVLERPSASSKDYCTACDSYGHFASECPEARDVDIGNDDDFRMQSIGDQPLSALKPPDHLAPPEATAGRTKLRKCENCQNVDEPGHVCLPARPAAHTPSSSPVQVSDLQHEVRIELPGVVITISPIKQGGS